MAYEIPNNFNIGPGRGDILGQGSSFGGANSLPGASTFNGPRFSGPGRGDILQGLNFQNQGIPRPQAFNGYTRQQNPFANSGGLGYNNPSGQNLSPGDMSFLARQLQQRIPNALQFPTSQQQTVQGYPLPAPPGQIGATPGGLQGPTQLPPQILYSPTGGYGGGLQSIQERMNALQPSIQARSDYLRQIYPEIPSGNFNNTQPSAANPNGALFQQILPQLASLMGLF